MTGADVGVAVILLLIVGSFTLYVRVIPYRHEMRKRDRDRLRAGRQQR